MGNWFKVIIIGGGATGTGILRDLALRGVDCLLLEKEDFATGTSGRFHGLLHSGARYAVKDPHSAEECIQENKILKQIAPGCVEDTGGLFVATGEDDLAYSEKWLEGCKNAGIEVQEISPQEALLEEPRLAKNIKMVYRVPDAAIDGFRLCAANVRSAEKKGAQARNYTEVIDIIKEGNKVKGVIAKDLVTGKEEEIYCDMIINAAGAWAGKIAAMAGMDVNIVPDKGVLVVFNHRFTKNVINRLRPPGDGDIFVPHGSVTIFGTTSRETTDPEDNGATKEDVLALLGEGRKLIPDLDEIRLIRAFAGVRPLYQPDGGGTGRNATRDFSLIDHEKEAGITGMVSVVGGKLTTFRLMAKAVSDYVCTILKIPGESVTDQEPLVDDFCRLKPISKKEFLCQCEQVTEDMLLEAVEGKKRISLSDVRRLTRLGMGPCQGTFCTFRAAGFYQKQKKLSVSQVNAMLEEHVQERWKGNHPVLWGGQAQEAEITRGVYLSLLNLDKLERCDGNV